MPVKQDWAPYTDWTEMEFWPAGRAPLTHFGVIDGGPLAERYRVFCRQRFFWMQQRAPSCCAMGLRITLPHGARYKPEAARLEFRHAVGCPRGDAS